MLEATWIAGFDAFIDRLVDARIKHVVSWIDANVARFKDHGDIRDLRRHLDAVVVELKLHVQLCKVQCDDCRLQCVESKLHNGKHNCSTDHACQFPCDFADKHKENPARCTLPYVRPPLLCSIRFIQLNSAGHDGKHM
jgi:hypothetical protein